MFYPYVVKVVVLSKKLVAIASFNYANVFSFFLEIAMDWSRSFYLQYWLLHQTAWLLRGVFQHSIYSSAKVDLQQANLPYLKGSSSTGMVFLLQNLIQDKPLQNFSMWRREEKQDHQFTFTKRGNLFQNSFLGVSLDNC